MINALEARLNIALADYNEKARRDREKSAATPFTPGGEMGGGTLAAKVAIKISNDRAASEGIDTGEAIAPAGAIGGAGSGYAGNTGFADAGSYVDADGPEWPDAATEAAFLGVGGQAHIAADAQSLTGNSPARARDEEDEDVDDKTAGGAGKTLPALDALVARIPGETREVLEELFRARFVKVSKIPRKRIE